MGIDKKKILLLHMEAGLRKGYRMDIDDTIKSAISLDTLEMGASINRFYSSSCFTRHHCHHLQHLYRKRERGYFQEEFRKAKPPTFDGEMTKSEDEKA